MGVHPTAEDVQKIKKRENARSAIAAVGDGISALANLYNTSKGADNVTAPTLSANNHKRYEQYRQRLEKLDDERQRMKLDARYKDKMHEYQMHRDKVKDQQWDASFKSGEEKWKKSFQHTLDEAARSQLNADRNYNEGVRQFGERMNQQNKQMETSKAQFNASHDLQNRGLDLRENELAANEGRRKQISLYNFERAQGSKIPFAIGGKTYVVGAKSLDENIGNMAAAILHDLRNSEKFKHLSDEELAKDPEFRSIKKSLDASKVDAKKLAETVKTYMHQSPSAQNMLQDMHNYYERERKYAETGVYEDYMPEDSGTRKSPTGATDEGGKKKSPTA